FQPARIRYVGLVSSTPHRTSFPFSSGTITSIQVCGFCQRNSLTVPTSFTSLVRSNAAGEWCAPTDTTGASTTTHAHLSKNFCIAPPTRYLTDRKSVGEG